MTIVSYRNRFTTLYVYALLLLLLVKEIGFKNEREKIGFYFIGLGEILSLLPTYPFKGSKFHVVLFQKCSCGLVQFLVLKMVLKKGIRGRVGIRIENK